MLTVVIPVVFANTPSQFFFLQRPLFIDLTIVTPLLTFVAFVKKKKEQKTTYLLKKSNTKSMDFHFFLAVRKKP